MPKAPPLSQLELVPFATGTLPFAFSQKLMRTDGR